MQKLFTIILNEIWSWRSDALCLRYPSEGLKQAEGIGKSKEISKLKARFREKSDRKCSLNAETYSVSEIRRPSLADHRP